MAKQVREDKSRLNLSDDERANLGKKLLSKIRQARDGMQELLDRRDEWFAFYQNDIPEKDFPWEGASNVNVPLTQWQVDTFHAHVNNTILGVSPPVFVKPPLAYANDPEIRQAAQAVENMLEHVMLHKMELHHTSDAVHQEALISGTAIRKVMHVAEFRQTFTEETLTDPDTGEVITERIETLMPKHVGPVEKLVTLPNFVVFPLTVTDPDEADIIGDRFRLTPDQVKRKIKDGYFDKEQATTILERPSNERGGLEDEYEDSELDRRGIDRVDRDEFYFWEIIAGYDANGDGLEEDCVFVIEQDTGTIVRAARFPYKHGRRYYIPTRPLPLPRSFFGRSLPQVINHMQREINAIHNMRSDATTLALCKSFKRLRSSSAEADTWRLHPGSIALVDSMDEIEEFVINPVVPGIEVENIDRDYSERATGATDIATGRHTEGTKTATEIGVVQSEGGIRFSDIIKRLQRPMAELAEQIIGLLEQFAPEEELELYGITREMLRIPWIYQPHGTLATANKPAQRQETTLLYQALMQNPLVQRDPMHIYNLTERLLQAYDWDDCESYIGTEDDLKQFVEEEKSKAEQAQQQQMAMVQAQQAQQMAEAQQSQLDKMLQAKREQEKLQLQKVETAAKLAERFTR